MSRIPEPASDRQMTYLDVLQRKLSNLLEEGSSISDDLERVAASSLSKREAGKLIDTLIQAINRLGGNEDATVTPLRRESERAKEKRERAELEKQRRAEVMATVNEYDEEQIRQFGGDKRNTREAPEGRGRYLKVWKIRPNHAYYSAWPVSSQACYSNVEIGYGWVWECTHPSHLGKGGPGSKSGRVRGGSITQGFAGTVEGAERHWWKFHAKE